MAAPPRCFFLLSTSDIVLLGTLCSDSPRSSRPQRASERSRRSQSGSTTRGHTQLVHVPAALWERWATRVTGGRTSGNV